MNPTRNTLHTIELSVSHVIVYVLAFLMIVPFLWMVLTAFESSSQIYHIPTILWPHPFYWFNFTKSWNDAPFGQFYVNTIWVASITTLFQVVTSILAGYAFARLRFFGKQFLFMIALSTMMIPFQVIMIPEFLIMKHLDLVNNLWALILPNASTGFGIFLMRQFFLQIPIEIEEAAAIDGASKFTTIWRIMVPLARPAIATLVLFAFLGAWNSYLWPLVILNNPAEMTIPAGLSYFQVVHATQENRQIAGSLVSIIPIVVLYLLTRRQFIEGIVAGSVKG